MGRLLAKTGFTGALRHRDLRLLLTSTTISATGSWAYNVALLAFVFDKTQSLAWVGAAGVVRFVPALVATPIVGAIADRFERRALLVVCDVLCTLLMLGLAVTAWADGPVVLALVLAGVSASVSAAYGPVDNAMIPTLVPEEDLAAANALTGLIENLVTLVGPLLGALLVAVASTGTTFAVNAATFAVSALLLFAMRTRSRAQPAEGEEPTRFVAGLKAIASSPVVVAAVGFSVIASLVYGSDTVLFVSLGEDKLGLGPEGFGVLLAGMGIGGILVAPFISRLAEVPRLGMVLLGGMFLFCVPLVAHVWIASPPAGFGVQVLRGAGTLVVDALAMVALQRAVPDEIAARVFGVFFALVLGAITIGAAFTPAVVSGLGLDGALWAFGLGVPALCLLAWPALRRMDAETAARLAELAPRIALLERVGPFAAAPRAALERLASAAAERSAAAGTAIVTEGEEADAFYVLVSGTVEVTVDGRPVRTLGDGDFFGEVGLLAGSERTATVTATTACELLRIDGEAFLAGLSTPGPAGIVGEAARARLAFTHPTRPAPEVPA